MERWLFLHKEKKEKIKEFAYGLERQLGDYWNFSGRVDYQLARERLPGYSLEKCFKQNNEFEDVKLAIGQKILLDKPTIRFAFQCNRIWNDFIIEHTPKNYAQTKKLFRKIFGVDLESYADQQILE